MTTAMTTASRVNTELARGAGHASTLGPRPAQVKTHRLQAELVGHWMAHKVAQCREARARLIEHYRHLVPKTRIHAVPSVPARIAVSDLEGAGYLALCRAVDKFDPNKGVKFESYAITLIRGAMLEYLRSDDSVSRSVRRKQKQLARAQDDIAMRYGPQEITQERLAGELELDIDAFYKFYAAADAVHVVSMEDALGDTDQDDNDSLAVREALACKASGPEQDALEQEQVSLLSQCIAWLPQQERIVVQRYYFEGKSLKEVARELERSESRAHQLHSQALKHLADFLQAHADAF